METGAVPPGASGGTGFIQVPATTRSDATTVSRQVLRYSRRSAQALDGPSRPPAPPPPPVSARSAVTAVPFTDSIRMGTIGTGPYSGSPFASSSRATAGA